jgi:hypothetical protein
LGFAKFENGEVSLVSPQAMLLIQAHHHYCENQTTMHESFVSIVNLSEVIHEQVNSL